jgi:hypothetical protein
MKYLHAILLCICAACGSSGGGNWNGDGGPPPIKDLVSITVLPADQTLTIDSGTPAASAYTAMGTFKDGHTADITSQCAFQLADTTLGGFLGAQFKSGTDKGGKTDVVAIAGALTGSTTLTLKLKERYADPQSTGLPANPASNFVGGFDPSRAPDLVYPNDGVLVPPNLAKLEIHFHPGPGNNLFALEFENDVTDVIVYAQCTSPLNGGCIYLPDATVWSWIAESNKGGAPLMVQVLGTDDSGTATVGTSGTISISFSQDELKGGIYYWTTSSGTGIMRFDFGSQTQTAPDMYLGTELTGGTCVGCHALSRDGTKLVAEAGGQNDGRLLLLDVATKMPIVPFASTPKSIFESWNGDGTQYVGVYGDSGATDYNLHVFDGTSGAQVATIDVGGTATNPADHPDWSPDSTHIAYTKTGIANTNQRMHEGSIEMVSDMGGGMWSPPAELVAQGAGQNHYYPAFSPDGAYLAYDESTCAGGVQDDSCNADTDPTATVFVMKAMPGATQIEMTRANAPGVADGATTALTNSFPKWCPFVFQRTTEMGSRLEWITFSSTRQYGLRSPPGTGTLLWMAAVDPDQIEAGVDPSYPAFALPFQDYTTSNHIAQWAESVVGVGKP